MALVNVWADAPDVPGNVCADARLRGSPRRREDATYGQVGWDLGVHFTSLQVLANQLTGLMLEWWAQSPLGYLRTPPPWERRPASRQIRPGEISRLAINAHGVENRLFVSGATNHADALAPETIPRYRQQLAQVGHLLAPYSRVYLMGCLTVPPADASQATLIRELSRVWPQTSVIGFSTIGYMAGGEMLRSGGAGCTEPGMRDTDQHHSVLESRQDEVYGSRWDSISSNYGSGMPWADERSPHSAVARRGEIVSVGGRPFVPPAPEPEWMSR